MYISEEYLRELLISSMPYRNAYSPTIEGLILFYVLPIALGFVICRPHAKYLSELKNIPISRLCFLSLATALFFNLPWLIFFLNDLSKDMYLFLAVAYLFLLMPVLFMIGISLNLIGNKWQIPTITKTTKHKKYISYTIIILLMLVIAALNSIPISLSDYPVGADVYFHTASTNRIAEGNGFFNDPRFYEEKNFFYPPLFPLIIAELSKITHISIVDLWRYYPIILSPIFIFLIFYFVKLITGDYVISIITVLFLFPWNQILWMDHSPKLFAYSLLILMLIFWYRFFKQKKIIYLIYSIFIFLLISLSHIEIAVHAAIIVGIYLIIELLKGTIFITDGVKKILHWKQKTHNLEDYTIYNPNTDNKKFSLIILLYFIVFLYFIYISEYFNKDNLLVFNEIALSTFSPIGIITLLVFLLTPIGLLNIKELSNENAIILSIAFLYSSVFFYFTLIWELYHRYFSETAYIGLAILSGKIITAQLNYNKYSGKIICYVIIILLILPLAPRFGFIESYSAQTQKIIEAKINIIEDIKKIDDINAVILTDPNDIINRFIPALTGKYIFSASITTNKKQQWQVISVPSYMSDRIQKRVDLANKFFEKLDDDNLKEIKNEYKITHLLLKQGDYDKLDDAIVGNSKIIAKNDGYVLLEIAV